MMNRIVLAPGIACALFVISAYAQSDQDTAKAAITQNFQFINHPPAPATQASAPVAANSHGHRRHQTSMDNEQSQQ
jgi:hypothetical protein